MNTRKTLAGIAATLMIAAAIGACSGSVETQATTGSGGDAATSGTATATATSSSGQGGGGTFCGGKAGIPCAPGQFCAFDPPGSCGNADGGGTCKMDPEGCTADCPGVCGCDGKFYCNACNANSAGTDVLSGAANTCLPDAGSSAIYSAQEVITNVPRFALYKADPARDVCFRLVLEGLDGGPQLGIATPTGWSIELAEVTDHASDCVGGPSGFPAAPIGAVVQATGGSGKIDFPVNGPPPCVVTIHASLSFPKGAPFVPANEPLDADALSVSGGCPP